jgi:pimeloyl-ACP methyl ester carboxylesterase
MARLPAIRALQTRSGRLGYILSGSGDPPIVLFSGAGVSVQGWEALYPDIERLGRVFGWNRFGLQGSDPPPPRQTGTVVLGSLRELLGYADVPRPCVLVAHSLGGLYANLFARLYPKEVAGVLFLEAAHPHDGELLRKHGDELAQSLAKLLTQPDALLRANVERELACVAETALEIANAGPFPAIPVRVLTGGLTPRGAMLSPAAVAAKRANQQALARLSPLGEQVIAHKSGHFPQLTQPRLVLDVLAELLRALERVP